VTAGPSSAETPSAQESAAAEALFVEAKRLMAAGRHGEACPKLAESQRLDPGGGTLVALALCHEAEGKTASAWAEFGEALTLALKDGRVDRATVAREHSARLEPKLSRLTIHVPPEIASLRGIEIVQDGVLLGRPAWGTALPVDPGEHRVEARATGKKTWSGSVVVAPDGDRKELSVGSLGDEAAASGPTAAASSSAVPLPSSTVASMPPAAPAPEPASGRRTAGFVVGGAGLALVGAASYFGLRAIANHKTATTYCPNPPTCQNHDAVDANDTSKTQATLSTIGFGLGAAALGVSAYLLLSGAPDKPPDPAQRTARRWELYPALTERTVGAALSTDW
jgi:hypothetical protein